MAGAHLNRKAKGELAELPVAADLAARGHKVAFPYGEDCDYDLIVDRAGSLERVQVKYAACDGTVIEISCRSHSLTNGKVRATKRYTADTVDWIAAYDSTSGRCFYVPASELGAGRSSLTLRLTPARNAQIARIRQADAYTSI